MFDAWYEDQKAHSLEWLQDLHRHPETGFEEVRTAAFVAQRLTDMGFDVVTGIGGTGVVGTLAGQTPNGRTIAFRAELDALPMQEQSGIEYASTDPKRFHGCGHDGHTVTALTAAAYLARIRDFDGHVRFIFQPAEELLAGARAMLTDGLFDRFPCDEIYALHNIPGLPIGAVGVPSTSALASADNIDVVIRANGAHGSMPHSGEDAIAAGAAFITSVQQAVSRLIDARDAGVISFGSFVGGTARNVLPDHVRIEGTMRTNDTGVRNRLAELLEDAAVSIRRLYRVELDLTVESVAPVTMNAPEAVEAVITSASRIVGVERVITNARSLMASEDFSELSARVPGAYFFVGQDGYYPHHPKYEFDPAIIPIGAAIFADLAKTRTGLQPAT